jgi:hypothetical protein
MRLETTFQAPSFAKLATQWNALHRPVIKYSIGIGGSIVIGDCITFKEVICCPIPPYYITASVGQVHDFKLHNNDALLFFCFVNISVFRDSAPDGITYPGLSILPNEVAVVHTNILYNVPVG